MHAIMTQYCQQHMVQLYTWKDAEIDYCRSLVMQGATREVPERCISSYLMTQQASARRDARPDCDAYLTELLAYWRGSARYLRQHPSDRN